MIVAWLLIVGTVLAVFVVKLLSSDEETGLWRTINPMTIWITLVLVVVVLALFTG